MPGRGRPFQAGQSGNPKGRPRGIQERVPRGAFKAAYERVLAKHPELLEQVIFDGLRGQRNARNAVPYVELGAKLGKEIGAGRDAVDTQPVIFHFHTNLNPLALAPRSLLQQQRSLPAPAVPATPPSRTTKRAGAKSTGGSQ